MKSDADEVAVGTGTDRREGGCRPGRAEWNPGLQIRYDTARAEGRLLDKSRKQREQRTAEISSDSYHFTDISESAGLLCPP